jgi:hypothetical protein
VLTLLCLAPFVAASAVAVDAGDLFANRVVVSGATGTSAGSTVGATHEVNEPLHAGFSGSGSVWRSWTAPVTGLVTFDTVGSPIDTLLAIYIGGAVDALAVVASDDDILYPSNLASLVQFEAHAGVTYAIAVDTNVGASGAFTLNWEQEVPPVEQFTLSLDAQGYGRVRINGNLQVLPYAQSFDADAQILVEAVPLGGWLFAGWSGDLTGTTNPSVVKMTADWSITLGFEPDPSLSLLSVPWYVDSAGAAQYIPPQDGKVATFVYLNNTLNTELSCFIEYYTQEGLFIGPFEENEFSIPARASIAFRPVADDPASVPGGQEGTTGLAVPNRPLNTDNGNDARRNGSIVIRFAASPEVLKGQVQSNSLGGGYGAYSTAYLLPPGVATSGGAVGACTVAVPWYVDNAGTAQGIPPRDSRNTTIVYLHNNRPVEKICIIQYFTEGGVPIGPATDNQFVIPANASLAFRPVADDPATVPGGQEAELGLTVPNRPLSTENGNDNKKNGSIRITWIGATDDVQGMVATYSYRENGGSFASSTTLPPAIVEPSE